ncbi:puromycin-sensitive aminopeptidase-like [Panonychus citri]|nr:puromycin-sensitive aminopeptidase-like [Panonychus citri]
MINGLLTRSLAVVVTGRSITQVYSSFRLITTSSLGKKCLLEKLKPSVSLCFDRQITMSTFLKAKKHYERLPRTVIPTLYKLELQPDLEKFVFSGKVDIDVSVKESTNSITLNVSEIEIQKATFKSGSQDSSMGQVTLDPVNEKALIKFGDNLKTGDGVLSLLFTGILNDKMKGFYRTKYTAPNGEERYAATTQFEAPDARRAFPCWDEPSFKAKFEVTIIAPKDRTVLSNTDPVSDIPHPENPNLRIVKFSPSPIMSTYLLAFIVGEYDYLETITKRNTRIRVYTQLGKKDQGTFALEVASKSLTLFEDYFDIPFPLNKLDHIAIPDFASGAMENWGLITYREVAVLTDPLNSSSATRERIAITVAHETAHQWFGNLVTMEWWTDLWLNEGFASFTEYLAVDKIFPHFDIWSQFVAFASLPALDLDSLRSSHPIEVPVDHPDDIDSIFDLISYEKGASIIRMCHDWIGDDAFRKGLHEYLSKHAYGNAVTQDLWDSLEAASNQPVGKTMPTWTKQLGYPVIKVESRQDGNNRVLKLEQQKFSIDGVLTDEEKQMMWMIPISIITSKDPNKVALSTLMTERTTELIIPNVSPNDWIKLNPKVIGFYRVNYSTEMLNQFKSAISSKQLVAVDRLQILNDSWALALSGNISTRVVLSLLESYSDEDNYSTWVAIDNCFGKLGSLLSYTDLTDKFNALGVKLYSKIFDKLGFESKDPNAHTENLLRALVLNRLAKFKYDPVIKQSHVLFKSHLESKPINPDLRNCVYRSVASSCDDQTFDSFFKLYRQAELNEEKVRLLQATGATSDVERLRKVLQFSLSSEVKYQDGWIGVISTVGSKNGREEAWKFFKENAAEFKERYGSHHSNARLIACIISDFASDEKAKEVEEFFSQNSFSGHEQVILRGLEKIKSNSEWLKRELNDIKDYLDSKSN